jgi:hypothetical protein
MGRQHSGIARAGLASFALVAVLVGCGAATKAATAAPTPSPTPTPSPLPTPSPTPAPAAPLVVTFRNTGPAGSPWTAVQVSLVGEDGTVSGTFNDPGGVHGDAYIVGSNHVYFIDGATVKAMGRDGTITDAGQIPQVSTTVTADNEASFTALAVSPDESTLVFGIPLAIAGEHGATIDHSQLWTEPVGGTAASATMVYDYKAAGSVLLPFAWSTSAIWVSNIPTSGLGGAGPFIDYSSINASTFDASSHVLTAIPGGCYISDARAIDHSSSNYVCASVNPPILHVRLPSGTRTVSMQPASATGFGAFRISDDARYLAYGAFIGDFGSGSGHYVTTVVDLSSGAIAATVQGYTPKEWLSDDRLVVSPSYVGTGSYLLSPTFTNPAKIAPDQPVDALP